MKLTIEALNIKNRKKRITFIYDKCCELIDQKNSKRNICGFNCNKCYTGVTNGCCRMCMYQSDKGCTTSNLTCKLFYCNKVKEKHDVNTFDDLELLKLLNLKQKYFFKLNYFRKREDYLKDLYSYSFIYTSLRIILHQIKKLIIVKKKSIKKEIM